MSKTNKIHLIIPSFNRAAQLQLLLTSIQKNAPDLFDITVLFKASSEPYALAYEKLIDRCVRSTRSLYKPITFVYERDFRTDTLRALDSHYELTMFAVDDMICYQNIYNQCKRPYDLIYNELTIDRLPEKKPLCTFSLRLGENTRFENYIGLRPMFLREYWEDIESHHQVWRHRDYAGSSLGYPFSLDAHVFKTDFILSLCRETEFNSPNTLEGNLFRWNNHVGTPTSMGRFKQSTFFGNSVNLVNTAGFNNTNGVHFPASPEELNSRYLNGEVIDFNQLDFSSVASIHWEIPFAFREYKD